MEKEKQTIKPEKSFPELFLFFLKPASKSGYRTDPLIRSLETAHSDQFRSTNQWLETLDKEGLNLLEDLDAFQSQMTSEEKFLSIQKEYRRLKERASITLKILEQSNQILTEVKIAVCKYIIAFGRPLNAPEAKYLQPEEWMDAATLAELRLQKQADTSESKNLKKVLPIFCTFRSVICSYHGPATVSRQIRTMLISIDTIYEKISLKIQARSTSMKLVETTKELSTVKLDLNSIQGELEKKRTEAEKLSKLIHLRENTNAPAILIFLAICTLAGVAAYWMLTKKMDTSFESVPSVITENTCKDIYFHMKEKPRYRNQILIFKKFGESVYFRADHLTCEKLYKLDSIQVNAISELVKLDGTKTTPAAKADENGYGILEVKQLGINKLAIVLGSDIESDLNFKLKVLELSNSIRGTLVEQNRSEKAYVLIDLSLQRVKPRYQ